MGFLAGFSKEDITPSLDKKVFLAGFGRNRIAEGIHDRLWARCLSLSDGKTTVVLVSLDLIGLFYEPYVLKLRREFENTALIIASTHNHNGPDTLGLWGPDIFTSGLNPDYMNLLINKICLCISRALGSMKPVRLSVSADAREELMNMQGDGRPPIVKDPTLNILRAVDSTGEGVFTLIQWSNHPETLGGANRLITADFPGIICDKIEGEVGGGAVYVNGAIGGLLSPLDIEKPLIDPETHVKVEHKTFREMEVLGLRVADIALEAFEKGEEVKDAPIQVKFKKIFIPLRNRFFRILAGTGVLKRPVYTRGEVDDRTEYLNTSEFGKVKIVLGEDVLSEVGTLNIGPVQVALIPGEIYPELVNGGITRLPGADFPEAPFEPIIRHNMRGKYKFIVGLADDEIGYIIPMCEWDENPPWLNNSPEPPYGEVNSLGYDTARIVCESICSIL
ncbi:MAG: neutral/alkaline non-lysosomal ceramidase N-terminal domain-containing protein [Candidatus Bathyarchaeia archaeon]